MLNNEQKKIMMDHVDMLCKQLDKMNKKGDITPDELKRAGDVFDIVKDYETICAMEEYGQDPEEEIYSSMGYYGHNSRTAGMRRMPMYSAQGRDSMGRYSRDDANHKMRTDLELKLASATDEEERKAIMRCLRALDN